MEQSETAMSEFFSEVDETLQRFTTQLGVVEKGESSADIIGALYRDMHNLKGTSQLFGFHLVAQIAHAIEASLEPIRRFQIKLSGPMLDSLYKSIDVIEKILKASRNGKIEKSNLYTEEAKSVVTKLLGATTELFGADLALNNEKSIQLDEPPMQSNKLSPQQNQSAQAPNAVPPLAVPQSEPPTTSITANTPTSAPEGESSDVNSTVRIQVLLLDRLMNLVGEMVLVRNQMLQYGQKHDALEFLNLSQRLDVVTSELQGEVMKTRMQPIGSIFSKFQRVVRDLAKELGKQIQFTIQGAETELDKTLLEAIKDPLTHIIRNSCDHGLESPDERTKAGKNPEGRIHARAFHEGGHIIIEIVDDGRGLNTQKILEKAIERKLVTQEGASKLSEREVMNLIFAPGFSTAAKVTSVSGRGVGMDVVKTNLERTGGQVELHSQLGQGMTVRLKIPLTLAIVPALIVKTAGEQFAIPQVKLAELVRVENENGSNRIELLQGKPVYRLRGQLLSLLSLNEVIGTGSESKSVSGYESKSMNIVVLIGEGDPFGLIVDEIKDTADIVVKPLPQFLKKLQVYSGATIMGDGSVSLIVDVAGIAERGRLHQRGRRSDISDSDLAQKTKTIDLDYQDFLFFSLSSDSSYCLPLCLVHRLEEFNVSDIQTTGNQRIVKYRGSILPLISLNQFFGLPQHQSNSAKVSVIVIQKNSKNYGFEVNEVVDILGIQRNIEDPIREVKGVLGGVIVDQKVCTVIDIYGILDVLAGIEPVTRRQPSQVPNSSSSVDGARRDQKQKKILFAEDTVFFMKQVRKVLESQGFEITHAPDGEKAWNILSRSKPDEYDLVLTDIEMPNLNGFELAEKIRSSRDYGSKPLIALTTKFRDVDRERGRQAGFTKYLEKLRSDELLVAIDEVLGGLTS